MTAPTMPIDHFRTLADYNAWANRRLYDAVARLPDAEYRKARPSFFGSIRNTLNHLLVGDRVWLGRIEGVPSGIAALDQILHDGFAELRAAREVEDARVVRIAQALDPARLDDLLDYRTVAGAPMKTPLRWVLSHLFNHQTHHRGQAHCLLSDTAVAPPPLDLLFYLREICV